MYVWADGVYLQARMEEAAECMLVLIGATPEGKKELVGFQTGVRENAQSWRELLIDIKQRGLEIAPDLAVGDGEVSAVSCSGLTAAKGFSEDDEQVSRRKDERTSGVEVDWWITHVAIVLPFA